MTLRNCLLAACVAALATPALADDVEPVEAGAGLSLLGGLSAAAILPEGEDEGAKVFLGTESDEPIVRVDYWNVPDRPMIDLRRADRTLDALDEIMALVRTGEVPGELFEVDGQDCLARRAMLSATVECAVADMTVSLLRVAPMDPADPESARILGEVRDYASRMRLADLAEARSNAN